MLCIPIKNPDAPWKLNWFGLPWPIAHTIAEDIPYLKSRGVKGILSQANLSMDAWTNGLNFYVASKLLWDPTLDPETLKRRWIYGLFLEAGVHMADYYDAMEKSMASQVCISGDARRNATKVFTTQVLQTMRTSYNAAVAAAQDSAVKARLARVGKSLDYTERLMEIIHLAQTDTEGAAILLNNFIEEHDSIPTKWSRIVPEDIFDYLKAYLNVLQAK
ncbi:MAG: hypothetical protein CVU64_07820 [Deltaproteobacteria bacterium HGW-Deltaproteobacteria-21]|jgi:hypothetical protein|nr:MAG: hypothetical protein CVU64_07820 [Deltaproteobacteria bacterium HGW-Deltaproteobacteria-21]